MFIGEIRLSNQASDVVVVGGGTAGAVVAARLAEAGADVTLLESGPDYGHLTDGRWPADLLDATSLPTSHDWGYRGPAADGRSLLFDRAKVIGGCSAHNGSTMSAGWRGDWDQLPHGWHAESLAPSFSAAQIQTRIRVPADYEIQPFQRSFLDACGWAGVARTDDLLDVDGGAGVSVSPVNIVDGVRWNTAIAYLDPARSLRNLRIIPNALVDVVEIDSGRAVGVRAVIDGRIERVAAGTVVLAAGAYGTPAILQRSGIGPAALLASLGLSPVVDLPGVGSGLQDHPVLRLEFAATPMLASLLESFRTATGFLPEEQCVAKIASGASTDAPYDVHVFPWIEPDNDHGWRCVLPVGLLRPESTGEIRLAGNDPALPPRIDHAYLSDPADMDRMLDALDWLRRLVTSPHLAPLLGDALLAPPDHAQRAELAQWARSTHSHYWHPTGGAGIGGDSDSMAVCDARARVRGVEGIVVADASLLPRVPRCTPALPVTAIGEHVATIMTS